MSHHVPVPDLGLQYAFASAHVLDVFEWLQVVMRPCR